MSRLAEMQRLFATSIMRPVTALGDVRRTGQARAMKLLRATPRLGAQERLGIYTRSYWSRVLDSLGEDFPGLRAVLGAKRFDLIRKQYLEDCPSRTFTLRNLGEQLPHWIERHGWLVGPRLPLALEMARLEWAHIEAFDGAEFRPLATEQFSELTANSRLALQPHIRLLKLCYSVDETLLNVRDQLSAKGSIRKLRKAPRNLQFPVGLVVHRLDFQVHYKRIDLNTFALLDHISKGLPLGNVLEAAFRDSTVSESCWEEHLRNNFELFAALGWIGRTN